MPYSFIKYVAAATLAAGITFAQGPSSDPQPGAMSPNEGRPDAMRRHMDLDQMAQALNLTDAQKEKARTIFDQAKESAAPLREELRQNREKLSAAAKMANNDADIQKLATEQGRVLGQLIAIRTEASAKFYQILTPAQRVKHDQMHEEFRQRMRSERSGTGERE
jgi:Spy/CpxP family protein refolding chaperone